MRPFAWAFAASRGASLAERLAGRGVRLSTRRLVAGDEAAFADPSEPLARRRASGAARLAARGALAALGGPADAALPRAPGGFALWPAGFRGSLAHDQGLAVAAVARTRDIAALGVDVEPAQALPDEVAEIALLPAERRACARDPALARAIFAAKEAVYKAINPRDGGAPEYEDIAVDLAAGVAGLGDGRTLGLDFERGAFAGGERWIVVAYAPPGGRYGRAATGISAPMPERVGPTAA
ncbi:MAG TPA: 4'-phosphopantetheinyl transferase superfamily protein [Roseiarcus sp.]|nr:4'-phosphopantetheinyl transferase superfamily protein [Roseiarcus sp.]